MQKHFEVEEQILFPVLLPFASVQDVVTGLIDEHRRIAAIVDQLRKRGDRSLIAEFAALLREHVRKEEGVLFEETQRLLPREKLDHIGEQIASIL
jgi:hemerythrin-like domain-containing protein